jgi:hypothetical protein
MMDNMELSFFVVGIVLTIVVGTVFYQFMKKEIK